MGNQGSADEAPKRRGAHRAGPKIRSHGGSRATRLKNEAKRRNARHKIIRVAWRERQAFLERMQKSLLHEDDDLKKETSVDIPDVLSQALGGLSLKERTALRAASKSFRTIEECDGAFWRSMLRDEEQKGWSAEASLWIVTDSRMQTWMKSRGYGLDSPCLASEVYARGPQFRAKQILYSDSNWKSAAVLAVMPKFEQYLVRMTDRTVVPDYLPNVIRAAVRDGLSQLVFGGWIDFDLDIKPILSGIMGGESFMTKVDAMDIMTQIATQSPSAGGSSHILDAAVELTRYKRRVNLFQLLTDPNLVGSDGVRFTIGDLLPRDTSPYIQLRRWNGFFADPFFLTMFCSKYVSISFWLARPEDEKAVWLSLQTIIDQTLSDNEREYLYNENIFGRSCFFETVKALLSRKREIEPNTAIVMRFANTFIPTPANVNGRPQPPNFKHPQMPVWIAEWIENLTFFNPDEQEEGPYDGRIVDEPGMEDESESSESE